MSNLEILPTLPLLQRRGAWNLHAKGMLGIVVVCIFLSALATSQCHYALTATKPGVSAVPSLLFGAVSWLWWGMVAAGLWWAVSWVPWLLRFSWKSMLFHTPRTA